MLENKIVDDGKYYIYRHIRCDKNEPFYIGIGTKSNKKPYKRAKSADGRNKEWYSIKSVTKFIPEIILESNDRDFIKQKEKEFIQLYGLLYDNSGPLVNILTGNKESTKQKLVRNNPNIPDGFITIKEFPAYAINKQGIILSLQSGTHLKPRIGKANPYVILWNNGKPYERSLTQLVAKIFVSNPLNYTTIIYKDKNKLNNSWDNLTWVSKENKAIIDIKETDKNKLYSFSKLLKSEIKEVMYLLEHSNLKQIELAKLYNTTRKVIYNISKNKEKYKLNGLL